MIGLGTAVNAAAVLVGGAIGLMVHNQPSKDVQNNVKAVLVILTFFAAAHMMWSGLGGSFGQISKQVGIMLLALVLGNIIGKVAGIQRRLARFGQYATERFSKAQQDGKPPASEGFVTCTLLFCVGPMAIMGAIQDGMIGDPKTLFIKAVLDGLTALSFASIFGWGVMLSVIPLVAYQGTITLLAHGLASHLDDPMLNSLNATGGMLLLCLPLVIYEVRKVPLADYLPALVLAPLLTKWLH